MTEQLSTQNTNETKGTRFPWGRVLATGSGVIMAVGLTAPFIISTEMADRQEAADREPALAAARQDGFDPTYFEGGMPDYATIHFKVASRAGAVCFPSANVLITRDSSGRLVDLHQYSMTGYANPHMERQGGAPHQRDVVTGVPYRIEFENLDQLQAAAGGPDHDFCAAQGATAAFLNQNRLG